MPHRRVNSGVAVSDPLWYKDAIVYELHVRAFCDSDEDGIGDFRGLTEKLDYLHDLGITAIWLLPFYPSPLRDDGYDISDYTDVHPNYGTLHDFKTFLREAHERGLQVIIELVLNHTSDKHPWFQRARSARPGSHGRQYYVWSNKPEKYKDARLIFKDFETSNWTWDAAAKAYYWHRFYWHQPDLNFDNPVVRRAMLRVVDFWLGLGVDGLRLDAVPYLYEREGTNCENLPETHAFLKELRHHVDARFKNRMLLAEANQWPEDAAAYFGEGDECHMAFHFPLMPRLFMALRMEDRFPITDIMEQTPSIPDLCQWATFLRNHDELTLEMVTDEERDYMYRVYAHDPSMRVNLGIRRRLASLLNNDRKKIELLNVMLFSLSGTPVIYYGDEIGMGDNFHLGDRSGVRTPMQWSADRNGGFSRANAQKLYLPVIIDPEYHYEAVNVEAQQQNPDSLLWWMKHLIALRKQYKAFGRGSLEFLSSDNTKVLSFIRSYRDETILVVANLSRMAQHSCLVMDKFKGLVPTELFGRNEFPVVEEKPYPVTLGPHAFYLFSLERQRTAAVTMRVEQAELETSLPTITMEGEWRDIFRKEHHEALADVLVEYIRGRRWFRGKARHIDLSEISDVVPVTHEDSIAYLVLMRIDYLEGEPETYFVPLSFASGEAATRLLAETPQMVAASVKFVGGDKDADGVLYDGLADAAFCTAALDAISRHRHLRSDSGQIEAIPTRAFRRIRGHDDLALTPSLLKAEQTNTSVAFGDRLVLKAYRRVDEGRNPDFEIGHFLTEKRAFPHIPRVAGFLEYRRHPNAEPLTLGLLTAYVPNQGDAWHYTLDYLNQYFERVLTIPKAAAMPVPDRSLLALAGETVPGQVGEAIGPYLVSAQLLGQRAGELHRALASAPDDPLFAPEPFTLIYQRSVYQSMRSLTRQVFRLLRERIGQVPEQSKEDAQKVLSLETSIIARFQYLLKTRISAMRIRCHGDLHLGQVLYTGKDFVFIDFEGEPARPLSERRIKRSPLRDVAGMIRSFHYAANAALFFHKRTLIRPEDMPVLEQWAQLWYTWVAASFLKSYLSVEDEPASLPRNQETLRLLLDALLLEKAVYEMAYELNNRPDWVRVPLQGILQLLKEEA